MKLAATLILISFASVMFCGLMLVNTHDTHSMLPQNSGVVAHHISMYEDVSTAIFSSVGSIFAIFLSLLALAIIVAIFQVQELWTSSNRVIPKRNSGTNLLYKLKRWLALFERSPSVA